MPEAHKSLLLAAVAVLLFTFIFQLNNGVDVGHTQNSLRTSIGRLHPVTLHENMSLPFPSGIPFVVDLQQMMKTDDFALVKGYATDFSNSYLEFLKPWVAKGYFKVCFIPGLCMRYASCLTQ
jgi:hypothetical protein